MSIAKKITKISRIVDRIRISGSSGKLKRNRPMQRADQMKIRPRQNKKPKKGSILILLALYYNELGDRISDFLIKNKRGESCMAIRPSVTPRRGHRKTGTVTR